MQGGGGGFEKAHIPKIPLHRTVDFSKIHMLLGTDKS